MPNKKGVKNVKNNLIHSWKGKIIPYENRTHVWTFNVLGGDSGTFCHIMPCIVRHDNPTEEHSKNATQFEQLNKA